MSREDFCIFHGFDYMKEDGMGVAWCERCAEDEPQEDYPEDRVTPTAEEFEALHRDKPA